jgi:hypothetical protein
MTDERRASISMGAAGRGPQTAPATRPSHAGETQGGMFTSGAGGAVGMLRRRDC